MGRNFPNPLLQYSNTPLLDSAEKPSECFDRLSMNGKISHDFNGSSLPVLWQTGVRPFDELRADFL